MSAAWTDKLPDWLVAAGTLGAVFVALFQGRANVRESASRTYFDHALSTLETAVSDFTRKTDAHGRPLNDRRHWLNFARAVGTAQQMASRIQTPELRELWKKTEHYWRERTYDVLDTLWNSFPVDYYGYSDPKEIHKNFATGPGERASLSESSLVFVYRWITWPSDYPDPLTKDAKFTDEELAKMESFGPRGLAEYIRIRRAPSSARGKPRN